MELSALPLSAGPGAGCSRTYIGSYLNCDFGRTCTNTPSRAVASSNSDCNLFEFGYARVDSSTEHKIAKTCADRNCELLPAHSRATLASSRVRIDGDVRIREPDMHMALEYGRRRRLVRRKSKMSRLGSTSRHREAACQRPGNAASPQAGVPAQLSKKHTRAARTVEAGSARGGAGETRRSRRPGPAAPWPQKERGSVKGKAPEGRV
jgi:hypothetical protein